MKLAGTVYDCLVDEPDGLTVPDLVDRLGYSSAYIRRGIRAARLTLAENDTLFILAEPQGRGMPWLYRLIDGAVIPDSEETAWTGNRIRDAQSRVKLLAAAMDTAVRATDARTIMGRKARLLSKQLSRLVEDLEEIDVE